MPWNRWDRGLIWNTGLSPGLQTYTTSDTPGTQHLETLLKHIQNLMSKFKTIREEAYRANMQLPELGLVLFTFGNASVADHGAGVFAIKPSGVAYADLSPEKMVVVDFDGNTVDGDLRPSSDTKTHAVRCKHWPKRGGIVHTHSPYATAWAQSQRDVPIFGTTHADHLTIDIPCAPPMADERIAGNYEYETGFQILDLFEQRG